MLVPTLVVPSQAPVAMGPHRKNVTVPLGVIEGRLPTTVAVPCTAVRGVSGPALDTWVVIVGTKFPKLPRTKSFSVAVVDVEERVSARKLAKHSLATLGSRDRLIPASRSSPCRYVALPLLSWYGHGATTPLAGLTSPQKGSLNANVTQFAASEGSSRCRFASAHYPNGLVVAGQAGCHIKSPGVRNATAVQHALVVRKA